uniref:DUF1330 domain-containing protein n=1 Tax=Sphingomonas sp. JE1 TaxID=1628059 RepID=A0A0D4ZZQ5_9SPHN|nr:MULTISPECIES: DUF1330 domain-containing protein [unclassified Sphingomonas]AJW29520.1 hypothetical protein pJE1_098 [Sphingomonas sp. JE1]
MVAYVVVMRERSKDLSHVANYISKAQEASSRHAMTIRALRGRHEVVEGAPVETVTILEFPTYEEAQAWYHDPAYQEALQDRQKAGEYHAVIVEGV